MKRELDQPRIELLGGHQRKAAGLGPRGRPSQRQCSRHDERRGQRRPCSGAARGPLPAWVDSPLPHLTDGELYSLRAGPGAVPTGLSWPERSAVGASPGPGQERLSRAPPWAARQARPASLRANQDRGPIARNHTDIGPGPPCRVMISFEAALVPDSPLASAPLWSPSPSVQEVCRDVAGPARCLGVAAGRGNYRAAHEYLPLAGEAVGVANSRLLAPSPNE